MEIEHYLNSGWEIKEETDKYYLLEKHGNIGVHLLLALFFWWLFFIPNIIYYFASKKKMVVKKKGRKKKTE